jgi:hypothetical protein
MANGAWASEQAELRKSTGCCVSRREKADAFFPFFSFGAELGNGRCRGGGNKESLLCVGEGMTVDRKDAVSPANVGWEIGQIGDCSGVCWFEVVNWLVCSGA